MQKVLVRSGFTYEWTQVTPSCALRSTTPRHACAPATDGAQACLGVVDRNAQEGVTWVHSYVNLDRTKTFCIYDGPTPEAIREVADRNQLPVDTITQVSVLDPYFYRAA